MTRTLALRTLSATELDMISGGTSGGAMIASTPMSQAQVTGRKSGEGQKDFLKITMKEVLVS